MRPFSSAQFCAAACSWLFVSAAFAQSPSLYVDPQQHFNIRVQPGWFAKSFDSSSASGVTIAQGADTYAQVLVQKGIDPAAFLRALNDNMQLTLPGYHINDQGSRTLAGQPSSFITGVSQDASGAHCTSVYLETFAANGYTYAAIVSSKGEDPQDKRMMANFNLARDMIE